jgi:hypothetical protein
MFGVAQDDRQNRRYFDSGGANPAPPPLRTTIQRYWLGGVAGFVVAGFSVEPFGFAAA